MRKETIIILVAISALSAKAQTNVDSLWNIWNDETQADTTRLNALSVMTWHGYLNSQPDSAFYFARMQYAFAESKGLKKLMADALNTQGASFAVRGDYPRALDHYQRSLRICKELEDNKGIANALNNIGIIYQDQGDLGNALDYFQRSLTIREGIGEKSGIAASLSNIGLVYQSQNDDPKALDYYKRGLNIFEEIGDKNGIANTTGNIGVLYEGQGDYQKAMEYYQRSLTLSEEIGDESGMANCMGNIGGIYQKEGDHQKAINECEKGLQLAQKIGDVSVQKYACKCLYDAYKANGNNNKALAYHEQMGALDDSLNAEATNKKLQQMEFEKVLAADREVQEQEITRQGLLRKGLIGGVTLVALLAGALLLLYRNSRRNEALLQVKNMAIMHAQTQLMQSERQREAEQVRSGIARDVHDQLGSDLTKLAMLGGEVRATANSDPAGMPAMAADIERLAGEANRSLSDIVWAVDPQRDTTAELVERIRAYSEGMLKGSGIAHRIDCRHDGDPRPLSPGVKRDLYLIVREALNNALKYANAQKVDVECVHANGHVHIVVTDDGAGFDLHRVGNGGNGLASMRARSQRTGASFGINTTMGKGTRISLKLELRD